MASVFDIKQLFSLRQPIRKQESPAVDFVYENMQDNTEYTLFGTPMTLPLWMKKQSETEAEWWLFPVEPMVTIGGANVLKKRTVAKLPLNKKSRGTIKERWAEDDFIISIDGVFINNSLNLSFSEKDIKKLYDFLSAREPLDVKCALFELFKINRIVVESYDFPFTKGVENQAYSIKAASDDEWDLLIKLEGKEDVL